MDFPAPLAPTNATTSPYLILILILLITFLDVRGYVNVTFSHTTSLFNVGIISTFLYSSFKSKYSNPFSTELIIS